MRAVHLTIGVLVAMLGSACMAGALHAEQTTLAEQSLQAWLDRFGEASYRVDHDPQRRITYATARDGMAEASHLKMRAALDELADHLADTLFDAPPDYDVFIAIASPRDARQLFRQHNIGGSYVHRNRRLVSRDTGGSLHHEFVHVMHYGHMERLGQAHQLWVQEGLASLYEDYRLTDGRVEFLPNDRNEITHNRARINRLVPWKSLFELPAERFMARATVLYPQARSMFEFVAAQGKLEAWYRAYVKHFDEDATGRKAFEIAFDADVGEVELQWQQWVKQQPIVSTEAIERGRPSLGVGTAAQGVNDGILITQVLPGSTASAANVQVGDILVAIDDQPTYTMADLRRAISRRAVGEQVVVRVRRGEAYESLSAPLRPLGGH